VSEEQRRSALAQQVERSLRASVELEGAILEAQQQIREESKVA
jgi:hypothetical protein